MSKYIDADALSEIVNEMMGRHSSGKAMKSACLFTMTMLVSAPAADVAPVVHAKWIPDGNEYRDFHCCSACDSLSFRKEDDDGYEFAEVLTEFCPYCGAKMDVEEVSG